jgi:CelD/BcsL family acetyltransferase involved in cellulose biosynthesis
LHALGLLRLIALRLDGRVIAVLYGLVDAPHIQHRRWYSYIGGFDPAFAALGPGTLILGHAIDRARAEGMSHFDCLRGAESYKYRWGAIDQPMFALRVTRAARPA